MKKIIVASAAVPALMQAMPAGARQNQNRLGEVPARGHSGKRHVH